MGKTKSKLLGGTVFILILCALQSSLTVLELDRQQVLSGEVWRIWTGHLVHSNMTHLSLNIIAALIIYLTFFSKIKLGSLLMYSFILAPLISMALLCIYPELNWYNGLSGLLHGLVAYCSIRMVRDGNKVFLVGLTIVWLKVLSETIRANLGYENLIGNMIVITEAHLMGVFIGTITAIIGMAFWHGGKGSRKGIMTSYSEKRPI